jgi:hypothetical protein
VKDCLNKLISNNHSTHPNVQLLLLLPFNTGAAGEMNQEGNKQTITMLKLAFPVVDEETPQRLNVKINLLINKIHNNVYHIYGPMAKSFQCKPTHWGVSPSHSALRVTGLIRDVEVCAGMITCGL